MDKITRISWKRVPLICTGLFLLILPLVHFDESFSNRLHLMMRPWDRWLQDITVMGDGLVVAKIFVVLTILLLLIKNHWWKRSALILVSIAVSAIPTHLLKHIFGRPRPYLMGDPRFHDIDFSRFYWFSNNPDFYSLPSGHSTTIFAVAWIVVKQKDIHWFFRSLMIVLAVAVSFSRIALAKHFLTDTIAGALVGIAVSEIMMNIYLYYFSKQSKT